MACVRILAQDRLPLPGALVQVEWTLPNGATRCQQRPANPVGVARFRVRSPQTGTYELCVTYVSKAGWTYDPGRNWETCDRIEVP